MPDLVEKENIFNVMLLGGEAVGKTTLSNRFANGIDTRIYLPTVGVNFYFKKVFVDGYNIKLQIWDTAGQDKFSTYLNDSYFQNTNCAVLMYDVSKRSSFKEIKLWIDHIDKHCKSIEKIIVGNKFDLSKDQRQVTEKEAEALANKFGFDWVELSSFDAKNVDRLFMSLIKAMLVVNLRQDALLRELKPQPQSEKAPAKKPLKVAPAPMFTPPVKPKKKAFRDECDVLFKILLVGEADVGKTSLMYRYVHQQFNMKYRATIGIDFESHVIRLDGKSIKLQIWDTAGQERFKSLSPQFYRGADAVVVVYDVTSRHSFDRVLSWIQSVQLQNSNDDVMLAIVGNKCDSPNTKREVDLKLGKQIAESLNVDMFIETSAKLGVNVAELFDELARKTIEKKKIDLKTIGLDKNATTALVPYRPGALESSLILKKQACCWK